METADVTTDDHDAIVRDSFSRQTVLFTGEHSVFAHRAIAAHTWLEPLDPQMIVLDVACGAAHAGEQAAPRVRQVVGVDITKALLDAGAQRLRDNGVDNVLLLEGDAAALRFLDESFDVVFCRAALHHMLQPERALAEMARVCKPGGRVVINDLITPNEAVRDAFDDVHRMLDPSHVRAFVPDELAALMQAVVGPIDSASFLDPFVLSIEHIFTEVADRDATRAALQAELDGGPPTGFDPARQGDEIMVTFRTAVVAARRPA
jgi:ubiquinone/menaquinone biosynthesis C-methylase UbiE